MPGFELEVPSAIGTYVPQHADGARALVLRLVEAQRSAVVSALGDSTGVGSGYGISQLIDWLGVQFPAFNVMKYGWSDTNQGFDRFTLSQVGAAGVPYVSLDGTGDYVTTPDSALNSVTGDIAVMAVVRAADYTPGATQTLISKYGSAPNLSWQLAIASSGAPVFTWSPDGTATIVKNPGVVIPGVVDNVTDIAVAVTLDVDNGAGGNDVKFWTAPFVNGQVGVFTQLGATQTTAGTTAVFDGNRGVEVGGVFSGSAGGFVGRVYYAEVRSGLSLTTSPIVAAMHPGLWVSGTTFTGPTGAVWTLGGDAAISGAPTLALLNGSTASTYLPYVTDETRFAKLTPIEPVLTIINYGLNGATATTLSTDYLATVDALIAKYPLADVLCTTQNPKTAPEYTAAEIRGQALRMDQVRRIAAVRNLMLVDSYRAFIDSGNPAALLDGGIHPNAAGTALVLAALKSPFRVWLTAA